MKSTDHQCVIAVYGELPDAKEALRKLESTEIPKERVSLVTHSVRGEMDEDEVNYGDKTEKNAAKGAGMGGLIGLLLGAPLVIVPGIGPILIAGPIGTGLAGAIVGGFLGAMSGWGVPNDHVKKYEKIVQSGSVLIVVNGEPDEVASARELLRDTNADEVHLHAESSADDPAITSN